jgi:hypothetical protein
VHPGSLRSETEKGATRQSLPATALADDREHLARREVEGDAVDGRDEAAPDRYFDDEIADREQGGRRDDPGQ